jgi:unsaturated chondroitin disaccharide hydrolase
LESRIVLDAPVRMENPGDVLLPLTEEPPVTEAQLSIPGVVDVGESILANRAPRSARVEAAALAAVNIDAAAVRAELVHFVDTWNGGQLGKLGTSGMGVYATTWDGLFRMNLDREFNRFVNTYTDDMTIISQSRAIYLNVEAYRNAPAADQARFKTAVQRGADYLLGKAVDHNTYSGQPGGMWWGLQPDGVSPPTHTTPIGGTAPRDKHAYGQVQSLFALAHAYSVTGDADHLNGAFTQLDVWNTQFADTAAGPGAFLQTANENYTQRIGNRNVDYMTHALEALLTLDEVTPASHPRKASLTTQITNIGNFITTRMYRNAAGSTTMGYLPWWYDAQWNPSPVATEQYSTPGHNFEMAFLLSRAVERGFNPAWLDVADKLLAYTLQYSFDNVPTSPTYGAVPHEKLAFNGARFDSAPDDLVWWQQSEAARTLLHFAAVRGRTDLWDEYLAASAFIRNRFIDPEYSGWYQYLNPSTLAPTTTIKGSVWTGGYHETMLDAERIRLGSESNVATLRAAADAYVRDGSYAGQNFGTAGDLIVKRSANVGNTRETYLRFDLSGTADVHGATLRVFGRSSSSTQDVSVALYTVATTGWSETGLTWNTKPTSAASAIASRTITGTTGTWYEFDITPYVVQQKAAGATAVALVLKATGTTDAQALFNSDENAASRPELVIQQAVSQALVVSTGTLAVPEGGSAQFTVKLAVQPTADVTVTVSKQSGDADLTGGGTLVFTPANWNTAQAVTVAAAADADTTNGSAIFAITSSGLATQTVTATETDDDVSAPVTIGATHATYVRDGTYSTQNFGTAGELQLKKSGTGSNREIWLKFDLSGVPSIASGKLRVFGRIDSSTETPTVAAYSAGNTIWTETALTWATRPAAGTTALATQTIATSTQKWYEWDLTSFLQAEKAAGRNVVTLVLRSLTTTTPYLIFNSDEAATNQPQLVVSTSATIPQALVVSTSTVNVPEGGNGQFTVTLATQPSGDVTVSVSRVSGDSDVSVSAGSTLLFTPASWNVPQQVTLAAAQDADSVNGLATIQVASPGLDVKSVTATEVDDDAPAAPVTLRASADAFVRNGTYATTNYGGQTTMSVKNHPSAGYTRESYLRFDLATAPAAIGSARLRLFGNLTETVAGGVAMQVYGVGNANWSESGITWNNRPAPSTGVLVTKTITGTTAAWYELDLTAYLQQQKSVGATVVTLLLRNAVAGNAQCVFSSDEATANRPELVITPAVATPVGVIVSTPTLAVPEGGAASIDVRLAAQPTSNVTVSITKQSGGDSDLNAAKATLTFTSANWSVAQSVNVTAAEDADSTTGSAVYVLSLAGGTPVNVVAAEIENDLAAAITTLRASDDAYVRGGTYAAMNFGGATDLVVKHSLSTSSIRETYVSFDLSAVADVSTAALRLYGRLSASTNPSLVTYIIPVSGAAWTESGINWNNRPTANATPLGWITVAGTAGKWYEFNVTGFVQAEKAAGRNRVTFVLRNHTPSDAQTLFASDEATANRPELVVASGSVSADIDTRLMSAVGVADAQLRQTLTDLGTDATKYVYVTEPDGHWRVIDANGWTSAMLPGSLWSMAKMTGQAFWITEAVRRTTPHAGQVTAPGDLAFRLAYAYWPLYASTGNVMYRQVLIDAAASKVANYNPIVGAFRTPGRASTSGNPDADFGVLMDQITDVELVLWAAQETNNAEWTDMAVRHLQTLSQYVMRPDGSTYQWTYFNSQTGEFIGGEGYQGYSANSTWSRGQAWAIYGFTASYRLTGRTEFLNAAKKVSDWYLAHLPAGDMVPYWDFNAPDIPNTYKDSSAAAVAAAGFTQLATLAPDPADAAKYLKAAGDTLSQLASPAYLSDGTTSRGILLHGAWFVPPPTEVGDCSTIWGDYFFLEAINRYMAAKATP